MIQLEVDEAALAARVKKRAAESGEAMRDDDTAEALHNRLEVYRRQTAPLIDHYRETGHLVTVDGMETIDKVTDGIDRVLERARDRRVRATG